MTEQKRCQCTSCAQECERPTIGMTEQKRCQCISWYQKCERRNRRWPT